ncbi:hypothetical protein [Shinella sp.]|uniref:hypothetical protein n=1 Tax=Shinella sp. TaxID=1870904 RepID=UPI0029BE6A89|nr:hypothetical protein [Shinella sp.]MDX3975777.1 hypothetical protein [Shinella sp.]
MKFNETLSIAQQGRRKLAPAMVLGMAISAVLGVSAQAGEIRKPAGQTKSVYQVKYRVDNDVRYGKNPAGNVVKISAMEYMNSNIYVCTPSGFGQKARCRAI